jgi:hypothetical protein
MLLSILAATLLAQGSPLMAGPSVAARGSTPVLADFLTIMGSSTSVGTVNDNICSQFPTELAGNYYCLHGDGTATNQTLTAHGAAASVSVAVCPNGTDCDNVSALRVGMTASDYYTTASYVQTQGDWSRCVRWRLPTADTGTIMHHAYVYWTTDSGGTVYPDAFKEGGGDLYANFAAQSGYIHAWTEGCVTYDFVGDGTSIYRLYTNGVQTTEILDATGPIGDLSSVPTFLGIRNNGTEPQNADIREVFYTEKILSPATIAAIYASGHPKLRGDNAEAISLTRLTPTSCPRADGVVTILRPGDACVNASGFWIWEGRNNEDIRSEDFCNAAWTCVDATPTCDTHRSPTSALTADTITTTAAGGFCESTASALVGGIAADSIYARSVSGTATGAIVLRDTTDGEDKCTGVISGTTTWARASCSGAITTGNDHSTRIYPGGVAGEGSMVVWGSMREVGESSTPYIQTVASAVGRNAEEASLTMASPTMTSGCWAATGTFTASSTAGSFLLAHEIEGALYTKGSPADSFSQTDLDVGAPPASTAAGTALAGTTVVVRGDWASGLSSQWGHRVADPGELVAGAMHISRAGAGSVTGTFTGDMNPDEVLYLGWRVAVGNYLNGALRNIRINTDYRGCRP